MRPFDHKECQSEFSRLAYIRIGVDMIKLIQKSIEPIESYAVRRHICLQYASCKFGWGFIPQLGAGGVVRETNVVNSQT